jgi:hypothetical protein
VRGRRSRSSSGVGMPFSALDRSNSPFGPGSTVLPPTSSFGRVSPREAAFASSFAWSLVRAAISSGEPAPPAPPLPRPPPLSEPPLMAAPITSRQSLYSSMSVGRFSSALRSSLFEYFPSSLPSSLQSLITWNGVAAASPQGKASTKSAASRSRCLETRITVRIGSSGKVFERPGDAARSGSAESLASTPPVPPRPG